MTNNKWQELIRKYDFDICLRSPEYETIESEKHSGKYIIVDYLDCGPNRFCLVGDNPEKLAQDCAEFWEFEN